MTPLILGGKLRKAAINPSVLCLSLPLIHAPRGEKWPLVARLSPGLPRYQSNQCIRLARNTRRLYLASSKDRSRRSRGHLGNCHRQCDLLQAEGCEEVDGSVGGGSENAVRMGLHQEDRMQGTSTKKTDEPGRICICDLLTSGLCARYYILLHHTRDSKITRKNIIT